MHTKTFQRKIKYILLIVFFLSVGLPEKTNTDWIRISKWFCCHWWTSARCATKKYSIAKSELVALSFLWSFF